MSVFYEQDVLPKKVAAKLAYQAGFALGAQTLSEDGDWLRGLLLDARVLMARHGSFQAAGRLMHVSEAGLHGLLNGAGFYPEAADEAGRARTEAGA
jgi:hypothetical protein